MVALSLFNVMIEGKPSLRFLVNQRMKPPEAPAEKLSLVNALADFVGQSVVRRTRLRHAVVGRGGWKDYEVGKLWGWRKLCEKRRCEAPEGLIQSRALLLSACGYFLQSVRREKAWRCQKFRCSPRCVFPTVISLLMSALIVITEG